ncbi:hypothetical protein Bpla01_55860 [Burkholderia plantarii]|nr:hypothetical protein Bpla01_55860 [Burkholderia plantarii]
MVAGAERLRDEPGRAHPQEAEAPVDEAEEQAAQRDAAQHLGAVEMAGYGRVDGAKDRLRQVREHDRHGEAEHPAVADAGAAGRDPGG